MENKSKQTLSNILHTCGREWRNNFDIVFMFHWHIAWDYARSNVVPVGLCLTWLSEFSGANDCTHGFRTSARYFDVSLSLFSLKTTLVDKHEYKTVIITTNAALTVIAYLCTSGERSFLRTNHSSFAVVCVRLCILTESVSLFHPLNVFGST